MVTYEFLYKEGDEGFYKYYVEGHKDKESCGIVAIKKRKKAVSQNWHRKMNLRIMLTTLFME